MLQCVDEYVYLGITFHYLAVIAKLGRYPRIIKISTLVIKYWLRINSSMYENQLVGKAARVCIQSHCPIAKFNDFLVEMCNFSCLKNITIWKESDNNVVKSNKNELCERFNIMWKDQIQRLSKLQLFKHVKPSCVRQRRMLPICDVMVRCQVKSRFGVVAFASFWCCLAFASLSCDNAMCFLSSLAFDGVLSFELGFRYSILFGICYTKG